MEPKYRIVRARDYRAEGHADTERAARAWARWRATNEGEAMLVLPECALIGETLVAPNDARLNSAGEWVR